MILFKQSHSNITSWHIKLIFNTLLINYPQSVNFLYLNIMNFKNTKRLNKSVSPMGERNITP